MVVEVRTSSDPDGVSELLKLVWQQKVSKSGSIHVWGFMRAREEAKMEMRGGTLVITRPSSTIAFPVSNAIMVTEGRRSLGLAVDGVQIRLLFRNRKERNEWRQEIRLEQRRTLEKKLQDFKIVCKLGKGGMANVFLVKDRTTGEKLAMKSVSRDVTVAGKDLERALEERILLETFHHPFILKLKYAFQTESHFHLLTEYCEGGDLQRLLSRRPGNKLLERTAKMIMAEIILALEHIHKGGAIYRDLKQENILLDGTGHIRLGDFGLARRLEGGRDGRAYSICGTYHYMAPEIFHKNGYTQAADIWALGILLYTLLEGVPPFELVPAEETLERRLLPFGNDISATAKDMIYDLLAFDPNDRPLIEDVKGHPFFSGVDFEAVLENANNAQEGFLFRSELEKLSKGELLYKSMAILRRGDREMLDKRVAGAYHRRH